MITYANILHHINVLISNTLFANRFDIEINSNDVKEGFSRPSFFIKFDDMSRTSSLHHVKKSFTVRIYYFPSDKNDCSIELLEVQEVLELIFDLKLRVFDRHLNINEVKSDVTDGVLHFYFDLEFEEGKEIEGDIEYMKNLEFKKGMN